MPEESGPAEPEARSTCACLNLRMAARALTHMYDGHLQEAGLRATQFSILSAVGLKGGLTISRLASLLVMDRTTLTRNLRPLEREGLIEIGRGQDRRTKALKLTAKGRERLAGALPLWQAAQRRFLDRFGAENWRALRQMLAAITAFARSA